MESKFSLMAAAVAKVRLRFDQCRSSLNSTCQGECCSVHVESVSVTLASFPDEMQGDAYSAPRRV